MYFILVDSFFTVYTAFFLFRLACYYGNFRMLVPPLGFALAFTTFSNFDLITDAISMKITQDYYYYCETSSNPKHKELASTFLLI